MPPTLMQCGCVATAEDREGNPVCAVHVGLDPGAEIVIEEPDFPPGRMATCLYCREAKPSALDLPMFVHKPEKEEDRYYCGCRGWD